MEETNSSLVVMSTLTLWPVTLEADLNEATGLTRAVNSTPLVLISQP